MLLSLSLSPSLSLSTTVVVIVAWEIIVLVYNIVYSIVHNKILSRTVKSQITMDTLKMHTQIQAMRRPDIQHPASKDSKYPDTRNHLYSSTFRKTPQESEQSLRHSRNRSLPAIASHLIAIAIAISIVLLLRARRPAPTCIDRQRPDHRLFLRPHTPHAASRKRQQQASQRTPVLRPTPALCCCTIQQGNISSPAAPEAMTLRASTAARQRCMSCILPTDQFTSTHRLGASGRFRSRVHISRRSVSQTSRSVPTTVQPPLESLRGWPIWVAVSRAAAVLGEETTASCRTHCDGIGETIVCGERKVG